MKARRCASAGTKARRLAGPWSPGWLAPKGSCTSARSASPPVTRPGLARPGDYRRGRLTAARPSAIRRAGR
eukprot:16449806-Heterocapsa_arctica.AAC.1